MKKISVALVVLNLISQISFGQNTTINKDKATKEVGLHKVMLIPFEPKLYNSEIDYQINKETKLSGKEIKYKFRDGMN
jgi:hypothetical protein